MAFACTNFSAYGFLVDDPVTKRMTQVFEGTFTGTTADVALDLGDVAGTFWTDVDGNALGLRAKTAFTEILTKTHRLLSQKCVEIEVGFVQAAADATGKVVLSQTSGKDVINYAVHAGEGLTSYQITFMWTLNDSEMAVRAS